MLRIVAVAASAAILSGCLALTPQNTAEDPLFARLAEIERRLESVERVVRNQSLVSMSQQVTALQRRVDELQGTTEEIEYNASTTSERQRDLYADLDQRIQDIAERLNAIGDSVSTPSASAPLVSIGSDSDNYQAAFQLLRDQRYDEAAASFRQFLEVFPESELAGNAQYWLAETYYVTQAYDEALTAFQTVLTRYPQSNKVADAILKSGFVYYEQKRWDQARSTLNRVRAEYPETAQSRLASQRLERMDSEGV